MALPTKLSFDKFDAERWEAILREMAQRAEEIGDEENAKMFYACAAIMYDFSKKLKAPPPTMLS